MSKQFYEQLNIKRSLRAVFLAVLVGCFNILFFSVSIINQITLIIQFCCLATVFVINRNLLTTKYKVFIASVCIISFLHSVLNGSGFGTVINFINIILAFSTLTSLSYERKLIRKIDSLILLALIALLLIYAKKEGVYYLPIFLSATQANSNLFLNPNGYATIALISGMLTTVVISRLNFEFARTKYALGAISFIIFVTVIYFTQARTSLVCYVAFEALCLFYSLFYTQAGKSFKRNTVFKGIVASLILSFAVVGIYMLLFAVLDNNFEILGKNIFTGRPQIWQDAFKQLSKSPIIGISNTYLFLDSYLNAHNGFIAILSYFGILPFICFIVIICKGYFSTNQTEYVFNVYKCFAVAVLFFLSTFETFMLDGNFYFLLLPILLCKEKVNDTKNNSLLLVRE